MVRVKLPIRTNLLTRFGSGKGHTLFRGPDQCAIRRYYKIFNLAKFWEMIFLRFAIILVNFNQSYAKMGDNELYKTEID